MAKLKITIHEQIEIDVEFPFYTKVNDFTYCFIKSENDGVSVHNYTTGFSIMTGLIPDKWFNAEQITKEEFDKNFKEVQEKINQLL